MNEILTSIKIEYRLLDTKRYIKYDYDRGFIVSHHHLTMGIFLIVKLFLLIKYQLTKYLSNDELIVILGGILSIITWWVL